MKKKIILAGILAGLMLTQTAFAQVSVSGGILDREFNESRTLYYVEIKSNEIPDIEAEGYEVVKKAETPYAGGALTEENTTIIKNTETGVRYRFVFEKKGGSVEVTDLSLTTAGALTVKGSIDGLKNIKLLILKPTEAYGDSTFSASEIDNAAMQETVLDVCEVSAEEIDGDMILEYSFPASAVSGQYGFLITADGISENYYSEIYYMSEEDIQDVIKNINEKSVFDEINTVVLLRKYVEDNSKRLYLDITDYDKLSDKAKNLAIEHLEAEGDYETLDEIGEAFYKGVTVAWIYDGLSPEEILKDNEYITLEMYENYLELEDKSDVKSKVKGLTTEEKIRESFNKAVAVSMINEADPADIKGIIEDYNQYLGIEESLYNYFMSNSSKCIKALGNKDFDDADDIADAIKKVKNSTTTGGGNTSSGGISSQIPTTSVTYVAPITEQKAEVTEAPVADNTALSKLPFTDIDNVSWAYTAIEHLYNNKILNGKSESLFAPNDNVKREEFVKLVVNGFGLEKEGTNGFEDVEKEAWYEEFLNVAFNTGVVTGLSETEFGVGKYITREDMAVMIYRAVEASGMNVEIIVENPAELSDLDTVSDYAKEAVEFMISKGAINGINGEFKPKAYATRAQTAQMLYQIIKIR